MSPVNTTFGSFTSRTFSAWIKPKVEVSGGVLTSDASYYYRTFTSSDTFLLTGSSLNIDFLVIAGGGAGAFGGGGGGAGGVRNKTATISPGSYSVVVGAGGGFGSSGNLSSFNSIIFGKNE